MRSPPEDGGVAEMENRRLDLALALLIGTTAIAGGCGAPAGPVPEPPDLAGTWLVNEAESDDLEERLSGGRREPEEEGESRLPGGNWERVPPTPSTLFAFSRIFKISQNDSTVSIVGADGTKRELYHDGRRVRQRLEGLGQVYTKARWKDRKLVVEHEVEGGAKVTETYELAPYGRKLELEVRLSGFVRNVKFKRVYNLVSDGGG